MGLVSTIDAQAFQDAADRVAGNAVVGELAKASGPTMAELLGDFPLTDKRTPKPKPAPTRVKVRRVQRRPNTTPAALVGESTPAGDPYKAAGILRPHEWAKQAHPEWANEAKLPRAFVRQMEQEYKAYVERTLAVAEQGRRTRKDETAIGEAEKDRALAREIAELRAKGQAAGSVDTMDRLQAAALEELLSGQPGAAYDAYRKLKAPSVGVTPRAGKMLLEEILGVEGIGGLQQAIQADPVKGWLQAYRRLSAFGYFANEQDAASSERFLESTKPTAEDVIQAHKKGRIDDDEKVELLRVILTPEQIEQLQRRRNESASPAPKLDRLPTFFGE